MDMQPSIVRAYRVWMPGLRRRRGKMASYPRDPTAIAQPDPSTGTLILRAEILMESNTLPYVPLRAVKAHSSCLACQQLREYSPDCIHDVTRHRQIADLKNRAPSTAAPAINRKRTQESSIAALCTCATLAHCRRPPHALYDKDFDSHSTFDSAQTAPAIKSTKACFRTPHTHVFRATCTCSFDTTSCCAVLLQRATASDRASCKQARGRPQNRHAGNLQCFIICVRGAADGMLLSSVCKLFCW
jgi:hypothetical protein